ncbi:hypothetical protein NPX13_g4579 [Xylaria arbuscula]|uniref:Uncharacterized protein n=1 Tax=Xylaria arbuscula TaxID=114810 RepID=A0A9W8NFK5_9PEZI|nr:hypothetical protein NPX13_g4579 [Xylaria arbuscula]
MPNSKSKAPPNRGSAPDKKYFQLWRRFYEPLVMLKILGSTRGEHSPKPQQQSPVHRFLDNLAYLADHDKGGSTTSAIGLEDAPDRFNFWIASNEPKQSVKSSIFLASFLQDVRVIADSTNGRRKSLEEKATHRCINFAKNRVKKEAKMLARDITKCMGCFTNPEDTELCEWLKRFQETEPLELCYMAYRERDSPMKGRLDGQLSPYNDSCTMDRRSVAIKDVVHRLGRLAHHVRAPHQVIEDVSNQPGLRNVLDEFQVHFIPSHLVVDRPNAEPNIHIHSILTRMLPCDGFNAEYREAADTMNRRFDIVKRFKDTFWSTFGEGGSSSRMIGWLPQGSRDPEYKHQRDILNEMAKSIREDALDQILRKTSAAPWHPDSQTGFTLRVPSVQGEVLQTTIDQAPLTDAMRMVDLDLATDSDESQPSSTGGYASGSRHSSAASMSDDSKRRMRKLSWPVIEDSDDDSDSSSGGAML